MASLRDRSRWWKGSWMEKAANTGRGFQEVLTGLRVQPLRDGLPSPAEILHGRSLITRRATPVNIAFICESLIVLQAKYIKNHDKARWARSRWALVIGEKIYYLTSNDKWQIGTVSGTRDTERGHGILTGKGTLLRRNRSHLKPQTFDIPIINGNFHSRTLTSSQSEINSMYISGLQHPPKVKYFHNNHYNNEYSLSQPAHPPKVIYSESVPKVVIKHIGDTAYDSYISETLVPLKSVIKPRKQTRFAGDAVTSVKTTPYQMDHQLGRSWLADTIRVVSSEPRGKPPVWRVTHNHWTNSKLKGVTVPAKLALLT